MTGFLRRLRALTVKELRQISRDPSSIMIGLVLPIILILIFGDQEHPCQRSMHNATHHSRHPHQCKILFQSHKPTHLKFNISWSKSCILDKR